MPLIERSPGVVVSRVNQFPKITADGLKAMKGRKKIVALTAYDFPMARLLDQTGAELILVGDSLGMVVLGYSDTTEVTMEDMLHHVRAAARAKPRGLLAADLPFNSYRTPIEAVENACRLIQAGAEAVKAEGGRSILDQVSAIIAAGIPFIGHVGMLPQHIREEGSYKIKGKTDDEHRALLEDCQALASAGAIAVVLELVTPSVARELTQSCSIPTIGIGSGADCDGQILVTTDLLGTSPGFIPRHVKIRGDLRADSVRIIETWSRSVWTPPTP